MVVTVDGQRRGRQNNILCRIVPDGRVGIEIRSHEQLIKSVRIGQCGVGGKAVLVDQAHHVAIDIAVVGTFEMEAVPDRYVITRTIVAPKTDDIVGGKRDGRVPGNIGLFYVAFEFVLDDIERRCGPFAPRH